MPKKKFGKRRDEKTLGCLNTRFVFYREEERMMEKLTNLEITSILLIP